MLSGIISSSIIASAHFVSSLVVVIAYMVLISIIEIPQLYMRYVAAIALGILAYIFWKEKAEDFANTQHGHLHDNNNDDILGLSREYEKQRFMSRVDHRKIILEGYCEKCKQHSIVRWSYAYYKGKWIDLDDYNNIRYNCPKCKTRDGCIIPSF